MNKPSRTFSLIHMSHSYVSRTHQSCHVWMITYEWVISVLSHMNNPFCIFSRVCVCIDETWLVISQMNGSHPYECVKSHTNFLPHHAPRGTNSHMHVRSRALSLSISFHSLSFTVSLTHTHVRMHYYFFSLIHTHSTHTQTHIHIHGHVGGCNSEESAFNASCCIS